MLEVMIPNSAKRVLDSLLNLFLFFLGCERAWLVRRIGNIGGERWGVDDFHLALRCHLAPPDE